ncbi:MAG: hypothetical protein KY475_15515 [Planctomycetes bacterium]|nr:hypothetical protein [Planctomycetota bacterium]
MLSGDWQNPVIAADVDFSGFVSLQDLLIIVTDLRASGVPHDLTSSSITTPAPGWSPARRR